MNQKLWRGISFSVFEPELLIPVISKSKQCLSRAEPAWVVPKPDLTCWSYLAEPAVPWAFCVFLLQIHILCMSSSYRMFPSYLFLHFKNVFKKIKYFYFFSLNSFFFLCFQIMVSKIILIYLLVKNTLKKQSLSYS